MTDATAEDASGRHEPALELRREASTMALYVAICLLAALTALPESAAHAKVTPLIWGVTVGLAVAHWFAFRVSARLVASGRLSSRDAALAGAQLVGAVGSRSSPRLRSSSSRWRRSSRAWRSCWPPSSRWSGTPSRAAAARRGPERCCTPSRCW